jgi:phospholipid/cholesterol/gamma-HCH transport system substrate-binding protein
VRQSGPACPSSAYRVRVKFTVQDGVAIGPETSGAAKVLSPIGTEYLELTPAGAGKLSGPIPCTRTTLPYNLVADLSQLGAQIQQYNIPQLQKSLEVGAQDISGTSPAEVSSAFTGLANLSKVLGQNSNNLAEIVNDGAALSSVLSSRSGQLVDLVNQSNLVLQVLQQRESTINQLLRATSALGADLTSILQTNNVPLHSVLASLTTVTGILAKDSGDITQAIPLLAAFSKYTANSTGSGAFADVALPTLLLPDNLLAQCSAASAYPSSNSQVGCRP